MGLNEITRVKRLACGWVIPAHPPLFLLLLHWAVSSQPTWKSFSPSSSPLMQDVLSAKTHQPTVWLSTYYISNIMLNFRWGSPESLPSSFQLVPFPKASRKLHNKGKNLFQGCQDVKINTAFNRSPLFFSSNAQGVIVSYKRVLQREHGGVMNTYNGNCWPGGSRFYILHLGYSLQVGKHFKGLTEPMHVQERPHRWVQNQMLAEDHDGMEKWQRQRGHGSHWLRGSTLHVQPLRGLMPWAQPSSTQGLSAS